MQLLFVVFIFTLCSCSTSTDTAKQMTYETVQNIRQGQCQKNLSLTDCESRQNYDSYQQNLKDVQ